MTGKLETDFRMPVPVGSTLHITAELNGTAGRKVYASARGHLDAPDGPVAVEARALFVVVDLEHFTAHGDADAPKKLRDSARVPERSDRWDINP